MENNTLKSGSKLKNGEYVIAQVLGQGGFGITYEAEQVSLGRRVAVKEFFMKDLCNRDAATSQVSVPSVGSLELVERFKLKFIREARMIAGFDNEHIVKIYDVFEENGTAYYVMEYLPGGSLSDLVKKQGALNESTAIDYISQIADALKYLHEQNTLHLDVKPSNVLLSQKGQLKLIDFGISKHYDEEGSQTSSTPVGISKGYAPLEQYQQGGDISKFTPATDIYALGATLYYLVTGTVPPDASEVAGEGLPETPESLSVKVKQAITKAMSFRKKDRPQDVYEFINLLNSGSSDVDEEETIIATNDVHEKPSQPDAKEKKWYGLAAILVAIVLIFCGCIYFYTLDSDSQQKQETPRAIESSIKTVQFGYAEYQNDRFNYRVKYPDNMKEGLRSQNGDGSIFRAADGSASLKIWGYWNNSCMNDGTLENEYNDALADYGKSVNYSLLKPTYFVITGIKSGKIFYRVTKWKEDIGVTALFEYDKEYKDFYNKACDRILSSLTIL